MRAHHLELAPDKTEAVLLAGMKRPRGLSFTLRGVRIEPSPTVKYLGVVIDKRLMFGAHAAKAKGKAMRAAMALMKIMPNVGGPSQLKRRVIAGVVNSIIRGPNMERCARMGKYRNILVQAQMVIALRVASAYRTVSSEVALVIAGIIPIWIQIEERTRRARKTGGEDTQFEALAG